MREWIFGNLEHVLCGLVLLSRISDIATTRLVTPNLKLEANPVVRKLGWKFALLSVLLCLVPYIEPALGIMILIPFLLVSANNATRIWASKAYGESGNLERILNLARKSTRKRAMAGYWFAGSMYVLAGAVLMFFYPDPGVDWGFWVAMGLMSYGLVIALHSSLFIRRVFKMAAGNPP